MRTGGILSLAMGLAAAALLSAGAGAAWAAWAAPTAAGLPASWAAPGPAQALAGASAADPAAAQGQPSFPHGVASGDVTSSGAIVWTRLDREADVTLEVFDNSELQGQPVFSRTVTATAARDFTVTVTVKRLVPATAYYYRWTSEGAQSPVGRFATAPAPNSAADLHLAYSGDSDGTRVDGVPYHGDFGVLDAARAGDPDFFVYLGDTIYSDSSLAPAPATTLDEYRAKYKENREIAALPELLKAMPIYAQWDDHEVYNDFDSQTVDPARYAAGRQAFLEYMPLNASRLPTDATCAGQPLMRSFKWGTNADTFIPDERSCRSASAEEQCLDANGNPDLAPTLPTTFRQLFGLPPNPPAGCVEAVNDPSRTMLGAVQKRKLERGLLASGAKFKIVLSELAIQQFWALPYDRWEGYGAERKEILAFIRRHRIRNVIFLTTDNHATIVNDVFIDRFRDPQPIAQEAITGPIGTFTFADEILSILPPEYLDYMQAALSLAGVDCRNLDTFSYGTLDVSSAAGTATVSLKDKEGNPLTDDVDPGKECTRTYGG